ncbi:hypothetical protein V6N13_032351 [Hibiscus sabdariffa]|uniref:Uncharacterized protein n=1 Tax=Hibiscus sabdariffa TaxID=183260 RepID=A0ABR2C1R2_9ROSI
MLECWDQVWSHVLQKYIPQRSLSNLKANQILQLMFGGQENLVRGGELRLNAGKRIYGNMVVRCEKIETVGWLVLDVRAYQGGNCLGLDSDTRSFMTFDLSEAISMFLQD